MKKILSLLGTITLIATSTTSLVACDNTEYTQEQLKELKKENKISINGNILEGMAPQEKPFNQADNKGYFVVWRVDKNRDGRIVKFKNNRSEKIIFDKYNKYDLQLGEDKTLVVYENKFPYRAGSGNLDDGERFKSIYRGDGDGEPNMSVIDPKTGKVTDLKKDK